MRHYPNRRPAGKSKRRRLTSSKKKIVTVPVTGPVEIATLRIANSVQSYTKGAPRGADLHEYAFDSAAEVGPKYAKDDILSELKKFLTREEFKYVTAHGEAKLDEFDSNNLSHANAFYTLQITAPKAVIEKIKGMSDEGWNTEVEEVQSSSVIYHKD